jgi:dimethylhistidine N-methyltransferase
MELLKDTERFQLVRLGQSENDKRDDNGDDVINALGQMPKTLPCKYFYDALGSQLFDRICDTPEYYPTRTERSILAASSDDIAAQTGDCELVELGSGSATKTRFLLAAYAKAAGVGNAIHFAPIDVSETALTESSHDLIAGFDTLTIRGFSGTYEQALHALHATPAKARMFIFLGSTLGNFRDPERLAFLARIKDAMEPGDYFLLGVDRHKDSQTLEAAYNDADGFTAQFNLNILTHLNHRFGGNFDITHFSHRAFYNEDARQIEMHLESLRDQTIRLNNLDFTVDFKKSETIHTEISKKFDPINTGNELASLGLTQTAVWSDAKEWFSLMLFQKGAQ